mmetsp:Transcript_2071/g.2185  ORF Transcript_2071/g.2185 Transcript_2071/m.2185 type:complete len:265 (-) Transcript_2071:953-1747(-)|eukprot:CAMPEP_0119040426 /NCGR_PEP_ID=MMETSP1177-20130426/10347_1 /TAXON_ID=2985 /ORGANISM="Ochromonas sp, Strain CCMP1899" /LENGTH=264 /DNA_ID=CAMNT_0007005457 /DNA_START=102 /DNA_END=896 /DNA_ORIENTATION=+
MSAIESCGNNSDEDNEEAQKDSGYCHFNEDGSASTFSISLFGHDLDIEQEPANTVLGHGAVVWDSAVIFAKYMEFDPKRFTVDKLQGKKVIELGSGCGLAGISLMMKGSKVTLTDMQKVTESLTAINVNRIYSRLRSKGKAFPNTLSPPSVFPLDWIDFKSFEEVSGLADCPYDIVLLTDCVFSASLAIPLVDCIRRLSGTNSTIYCCHEIRDEEANMYFLEEFGKYFTFKRIPRYKLHPEYTNNLVELIIAKQIRISKKNVDK